MTTQNFDVLIVGAGVSGVGMGCHLTRNCPDKSFAVIERRADLGGTWDLFRYPGIRSDSDMYTFGFNFRPWTGSKVLADGALIKQYVRETAEEYGVDKNIQFGIKVLSANWNESEQQWQIDAIEEATGEERKFTAGFLAGCTGYYNYDQGYKPEFPGEKDFKGQLIHPQHWPEDLDYDDKNVVVIGSGATAVTLVPAMAPKARHVTMLQRSPTYMIPIPSNDPVTGALQKSVPEMVAYRITRTRNILANKGLYELAQRSPKATRQLLQGVVKTQIGNAADMRHFTPKYAPWDQRLCAVSDGDLFKALKAGTASMATDEIDCFTEDGIRLKSGAELKADIIISATGLNVQMMGGVNLTVDGREVKVKDSMVYKNVMVEGVPNAGMIFGYTNLPWTLKADISAEYLCRLINHMDVKGYKKAVAVDLIGCQGEDTVMGALSSGYIRRAADTLPRQGRSGPWQVKQDYLRDTQELRYGGIEDDVLQFDGRTRGKAPKASRFPSFGGRLRAAFAS